MKGLILAFAFLFSGLTFGEEGLASKTFFLTEEESIKGAIVSLYESEIANADSKLSQELARISRDSVEDLGQLSNPTELDMWMISSGRGGYASYGQTYLLGIPVFWNGSGMIEEYIEYVVVNVSIDLDLDAGDEAVTKVTVFFEKVVTINY